MRRTREKDKEILDQFGHALVQFRSKKLHKWEKIDDEVQADNRLGSPSEDWIIPPDEDKTLRFLEKDPEYVNLREKILSLKAEVKKIAIFLGHGKKHTFEWVTFTNPLIGNSALEDAISSVQVLKRCCDKASYMWLNLTNFWR